MAGELGNYCREERLMLVDNQLLGEKQAKKRNGRQVTTVNVRRKEGRGLQEALLRSAMRTTHRSFWVQNVFSSADALFWWGPSTNKLVSKEFMGKNMPVSISNTWKIHIKCSQSFPFFWEKESHLPDMYSFATARKQCVWGGWLLQLWWKIWKIPNQKEDKEKRWCISKLPSYTCHPGKNCRKKDTQKKGNFIVFPRS